MTFRFLLKVPYILLLLPAPVLAADEVAPAAKPGPRAEEFYRIQGQINDLLAQLAVLQTKYRTATREQRDQILLQYNQLIAKGEEIEPKWLQAAEKAFEEAPNADEKIVILLLQLLFQKVDHDEYEQAFKIGRLLMENNCTDKRVANLAGIAAFATNHYDEAEKYLTLAAKNGRYKSLTEKDKVGLVGLTDLQYIPTYKQVWAKEEAVRRLEVDADNLPRVLLKTSQGDIELELFENQAPNTVANFISLVEKGFYNGLTFHRVIPGFMAQGGDPAGNGFGGPGYSIACECYQPNHRLHFRGSLSMALSQTGRDTGGSQFFLTFVPTPHLNGKHTVFGRVIAGMDVLAKLRRRDPADKEARPADRIIEAKVIRKRPHEYQPEKMPE